MQVKFTEEELRRIRDLEYHTGAISVIAPVDLGKFILVCILIYLFLLYKY